MRCRVSIVGFVLLAVSQMAHAENLVFQDDAFPYKIVCKPEWVEARRTRDTLILNKTSSAKKSRFQLARTPIDTSWFKRETDWSRYNFVINLGVASSVGRVISFDSSLTKRLGTFRAFEMFSLFADSTGNVCGAEYARWSEHDGIGFLASIIGDTLEMRQNGPANKAFLDSISISFTTPVAGRGPAHHPTPLRVAPEGAIAVEPFDLLGRTMPPGRLPSHRVLVGKEVGRCLFP